MPLMLLPFESLLVRIGHLMVLGLLCFMCHSCFSRSYLSLSALAISWYLAFSSLDSTPQRRPSSFTISPLCPIPKFGFWLITFWRSSLEKNMKAQRDLLGALGSFLARFCLKLPWYCCWTILPGVGITPPVDSFSQLLASSISL